METRDSGHSCPRGSVTRGEEMLQPDEVAAMMRLHGLGWGAKRLAREFGCARNTVRRYLRQGGATPFRQPARRSVLDGLEEWLRARFFQHGGNADVIRQELAAEHGVVLSLRHVERRVAGWRRELKAQARATMRFETPPGRQLQIDFGEARVWIGEERLRVHLFVATLGFSRRMHVRASLRNGRRTGSRGWRVPSFTSAACLPRCCSTMPGRLLSIMIRRHARSGSTPSFMPSRVIGASALAPAHRTGLEPRARTSAVSAM